MKGIEGVENELPGREVENTAADTVMVPKEMKKAKQELKKDLVEDEKKYIEKT